MALIYRSGLGSALILLFLVFPGSVTYGQADSAQGSVVGPWHAGTETRAGWFRWSDNLFQEGSFTRADITSTVMVGTTAFAEYGNVRVRVGYVGSIGKTTNSPYMPPFILEPYPSDRALGYFLLGTGIRWPGVPNTSPAALRWNVSLSLMYWANTVYEDTFHEISRESMTRIERAELDELFMEFGVDAAFPASKAFGITASLLFAYNLLGSNSSWSEDLTVMTTSRYIPIDFGIGVGISAVFRLD